MKKISLLLWIWTGSFVYAQDSVAIAPEIMVSETEYLGEYQPENETPPTEERVETEFHNRGLQAGFKEDYKGKEFDYDREEKTYRLPLFQLPAGLLKFLMYALLGAILLLIIYFILKNAGGISFGKERKKINFDSSEESGGEDWEEIRDYNFESLIQKAKAERDYRKAVRYYYLWVLQKLTDRNLIHWDKDKTDFDYLQELKNHAVRDDFSANTYIYDYTWYGKFELNETEFERAEAVFQKTLKKIH